MKKMLIGAAIGVASGLIFGSKIGSRKEKLRTKRAFKMLESHLDAYNKGLDAGRRTNVVAEKSENEEE